ncbi:MAG: glycosyltransferase [Bacteroidota bacterium]
MKIVHISNNDIGGAGIAAVRLHLALLERGIESYLLTSQKHTQRIPRHFQVDPTGYFLKKTAIKLGLMKDKIKEHALKHLANRPEGFEHFSFPFSETDLANHPLVRQAELVHLHWVSDDFLDFNSFFRKINKPVVWTLHDMNPFTGGCHHSDDCKGYIGNCSHCPQLKNTIDENYAAEMLKLKIDSLSLKKDSMQIIAPSLWLMKCSVNSKLFNGIDHHSIPNLADTKSFYPKDKDACRKKLNLPLDKKIILFIAKDSDNPRKGIHYLEDAVRQLNQDYLVCSVGKTELSFPGGINFNYIESSSTLNEIYNAADVFVLPSLAENLPNTIIEALLCGVPVAAFNIGGIPELINDKNGRLADYKSAKSLAESIKTILSNSDYFRKDEIAAEAKLRFDADVIVKSHLQIYESN